MPIPTYAEWKADTHQTRFGFQTGEFKKLDSALKKYDAAPSDPLKNALKGALNAWIAKEPGFDWKKSMRNETGMVEKLYTALNPYRTASAGWTAPPIPAAPRPGGVYLAQSFEYSNSKQRNDVPIAVQRAQALISRAYSGIAQARTATSAQRVIYERWFGAYSANRFAQVFNTVRDLYDALHLKPVVLYYRGPGAQGASDCPAEGGDIAAEDFFGAAWQPKHLPAQLDKRFTYIFLGSMFFKSGIYDNDSIPGVIIHELSHSVCGTDDVNYKGEDTYGPDLCKRLANEKPDLAIYNADSYEYLCENFQNTLFVPKALNLNLPAKASITLTLKGPG